MPLLPKHRVFLPICLTLGTLLWLRPASPLFADAPAAPAANETHWQKVLLDHVTPADLLAAQHWDKRSALPAGVTNIFGMQSTNSLLVEATPAGFAKLQEMVKILDIAPRPVEIQMVLAQVTPAELDAANISLDLAVDPATPKMMLGYATGKEAAQLAQTLHGQGEVLQSSRIFAFNNKEASLSLSEGQPVSDLPALESFTFVVKPRVNSDGSVTLALHPKASWRVAGKTDLNGMPLVTTQDLQVLRTLPSGETLVIANLFPGAVNTGGDQLLLFVTPTVLPSGDSRPTGPGR